MFDILTTFQKYMYQNPFLNFNKILILFSFLSKMEQISKNISRK